MTKRFAITTKDNPFDPFKEFDQWLAWDTRFSYDTLGLLSDLTFVSTELSDSDYNDAVERAIDEIIRDFGSDFYVKLTTEDNPPDIPLPR